MKQQTSSLSLAIRQGLGHVHNAFKAKLASYLAAIPNRTNPQASRINTNPNATQSAMQRVQMMWDGEAIVKSSDFGANYVQKRRMYCTNGANWSPNTGDTKRDEDLRAYLDDQWSRMGINQSMMSAFSKAADVELPMRGDSALVWVRDESQMRLQVVEADRIGEIYYFYGMGEKIDGLNYYAGVYSFPTDHDLFPGQNAAFRIFERIDQWYGNARVYPASDVLFFKDDLMEGVRGISKFAQCLPIVGNRDSILYATMQTMLQQSKIAAVASNNAGEPDELSYDTQTLQNGTVNYIERNSDGPVIRYQYNGDSFQVLRAEHPTDSFQLAMDRLDEKGSLACGFPYSFLFSPRDSGGAPSRFEYECAGKEILRLRDNVYRPKLNVISYVTIMDAIERKKFKSVIAQNKSTGQWENALLRGSWNFGTLPSADALHDAKSDEMEIRNGTKTRDMVTTANTGVPFSRILRISGSEAMAIEMETQDRNKELTAKGYNPTLTTDSIATVFPNPLQQQQSENLAQGGTTTGVSANPTAKAA